MGTKKEIVIKVDVDTNLAHDLLEFGGLETRDIFIINLEDKKEAVWNTIPEEEWKRLGAGKFQKS